MPKTPVGVETVREAALEAFLDVFGKADWLRIEVCETVISIGLHRKQENDSLFPQHIPPWSELTNDEAASALSAVAREAVHLLGSGADR